MATEPTKIKVVRRVVFVAFEMTLKKELVRTRAGREKLRQHIAISTDAELDISCGDLASAPKPPTVYLSIKELMAANPLEALAAIAPKKGGDSADHR